MPTSVFSISRRRCSLRIGYMPLIDAAPLVVAKQLGLFARVGLDVQLHREIGWATVRDKIIHGEFEAAHAPAPMLWSAQLGSGCPPCEVLTALVLNQHGNAITLAQSTWLAGVRDGETLRPHVARRRANERFTVGIPFRHSSHHLLLRRWLAAAGFESTRNVQVVVVPPTQMVQRLKAGLIEGYCVGEPWNSVAVRDGIGWCPAWSSALMPGVPEKVLMVRRLFAETYPAEHAALIGVLLEACAWCEEPENRPRIAEILAEGNFIDAPREALLPALTGSFDCGNKVVRSIPEFLVFHGAETNVPAVSAARKLQEQLLAAGTFENDERLVTLPEKLFREDIHRAVVAEYGLAQNKVTVAQRLAG
jgi:two-component system, oxyanion-binding sensor